MDPLEREFPWNSAYAYAEGDPVNFVDLDGGETSVTRPAAMPRPSVPGIRVPNTRNLGPTTRPYLATAPIGPNNSGSLPPGNTAYRSQGGWHITTNNGGFFRPDAKPPMTQQEREELRRQIEKNQLAEAINRNIYSEKATPLILPEFSLQAKPQPITTTPAPSASASTSESDDGDPYIYRGGNPGDANLTPRPGKDTEGPKRGLSTFTTAEKAKKMSGKMVATKISVNSLRTLGLTVDFIGDHASIRPATQKELDDWAATKQDAINGKGPSAITKKVQSSVRGTE